MFQTFASGFLVFAYFATALFQFALVAGAPMGEYAFGGQRTGKLPAGFRVVSGVSSLIMLALAGHYLAQLGVIPTLLDEAGNYLANWFLVGFSGLTALLNNISRSQKEKRLWGPVSLAMLLAATVVAI